MMFFVWINFGHANEASDLLLSAKNIFNDKNFSSFQKSLRVKAIYKRVSELELANQEEKQRLITEIGEFLRQIPLTQYEELVLKIPGYVYLFAMDGLPEDNLVRLEKLKNSSIEISKQARISAIMKGLNDDVVTRLKLEREVIDVRIRLISKTIDVLRDLFQEINENGTVSGVFYNVRNPSLLHLIRRLGVIQDEKEDILIEALKVYRAKFPNGLYNILSEYYSNKIILKIDQIAKSQGVKPELNLKDLYDIRDSLGSRSTQGLSEEHRSNIEKRLTTEIKKLETEAFAKIFPTTKEIYNEAYFHRGYPIISLNITLDNLDNALSILDAYINNRNVSYLSKRDQYVLSLISRESLIEKREEVSKQRDLFVESFSAVANIKDKSLVPEILSKLKKFMDLIGNRRYEVYGYQVEEAGALARLLGDAGGIRTDELQKFGYLPSLEFLLVVPPYNKMFIISANGYSDTIEDPSGLKVFLGKVKSMKIKDERTNHFYKLYFSTKAMLQGSDLTEVPLFDDGLNLLRHLVEVDFENNEKNFIKFLLSLKKSHPFHYNLIRSNLTSIMKKLIDEVGEDSDGDLNLKMEQVDFLLRVFSNELLEEDILSNAHKVELGKMASTKLGCSKQLSIMINSFKI